MEHRLSLALISLAIAGLAWTPVSAETAAGAVAKEPPISFNRDIRPILSDKCFACHGFDEKHREAGLRLDTFEGAVKGGDSGPAITPGDLTKSEAWRRITSQDDAELMPPPKSHKKITAAERALIQRWIEQGAQYQKHWSFEPVRRPAAAAREKAIDEFLTTRIQQSKLAVQPEADRETLIRRVAFALTGLPPTIRETDEFLADQKPGAYERMVDRYLASPRFGEEMARHWLDVARYADTHGLHLDNERQMWAYRDWVIQAFNEDLPFDQFTTWQVAGDLIPNATNEQKIASGFHRCTVTTSEGGSIAEEFVYRYAVERTTAVAQAWLGLTAGCAVCHDHKYDPLSTKEFYSLYAFFNSAADPAMDGNINTTAPFMKLPSSEQKTVAEAAGKAEKVARDWLDAVAAGVEYVDPADLKPPAPKQAVRDVLFDDAFPLGVATKSKSRNAIEWVSDPVFKTASGRRAIRQAFADSFTDTLEFKLKTLTVPQDSVFEVWFRPDPLDVPKSAAFGIQGKKTVAWTRGDKGLIRDGTQEPPLAPGEWNKLIIPAAAFDLKPGDRLTSVTLNINGGVGYWDSLVLSGQSEPKNDPLASFAAWQRRLGKGPFPELPPDLQGPVQAGAEKKLTDEQTAKLRRFYLAVLARPVNADLASARSAWELARAARLGSEESAPGTFVYGEMAKPRDSFVMLRGQYDKPGDKVEPNVPAVLPPIKKSPADRPSRLDLAQWLTAAENPLMARVTVNRFWQQFFGTGLVKTSFDFGSQGEPPTHPELLDWLAAEFRESGWKTKRFVKLLVMSAAFRRDSKATPDALAKDIFNRLYARGPRFRLDAEQIRDNALYVGNLMSFEMGGRGVNTYQPPNIWEPVGYSDSNTRYYQQGHGSALYRRSIYSFLKRTAPPPFMSNFDAPNREQVCTVRERSNTPLQALQLMNDIQQFEAARALAERAIADGGKSPEERLAYLYRTVLSRRPTGEETSLVLKAMQRQLELYRSDPDAAQLAIAVGESKPKNTASAPETAAWTMTANLILNLDETLNRN